MFKKILGGIIVLFILIQFIPYGKDHINPPIIKEAKFDTFKTKEFFKRSCMDCHGHETKWPWYSNVAPMSWSIYRHVKDGREHFNVSMWGVQEKNEADEAAKELRKGHMPIKSYMIAHPEARLSKKEREEFIQGLVATFGEEGEDLENND